jgi:hypothetical protein
MLVVLENFMVILPVSEERGGSSCCLSSVAIALLLVRAQGRVGNA